MDPVSVESRLTIEPRPVGDLEWDGQTLIFQPQAPWPEGSEVEVTLAAGAQSTRLIPMLRGISWSFEIREPRITYLWPAGEPADLYLISIDGKERVRLTETDHGVLDYTTHADGSRILYTAARQDGGSDIHQLDLSSGEDRLLYACPERVVCQKPTLQPNGDLLVFERLEFIVGAAGKPILGPSQVWGMDITSNGEVFPIGIIEHLTANPDWSPAGWLSYYDGTLRAIALLEEPFEDGPQPFNYIPNDLGLKGSWSEEGDELLLTEIVFTEAVADTQEGSETSPSFYSHIYRVNVLTGFTVDLTGGELGKVEDASPVYAPNGERVAFTRKYLDELRWTHGRQLWLMRPDGSEAHQILEDPLYGFSSLAWSPDSMSLVYMRKNQVNIGEPGEIWTLRVDGGEPKRLVEGGYLPQWVP
jgi:Tol biopolymer transport system component